MKRVVLACLLCAWLPLQALAAQETAPTEETARPETPPAAADSGKQAGEKKPEQAASGADEEPECD